MLHPIKHSTYACMKHLDSFMMRINCSTKRFQSIEINFSLVRSYLSSIISPPAVIGTVRDVGISPLTRLMPGILFIRGYFNHSFLFIRLFNCLFIGSGALAHFSSVKACDTVLVCYCVPPGDTE